MNDIKNILVYWDGESSLLEKPVLLGFLTVQMIRGKEVFSFAFDDDWLKNHSRFSALDPELQFYGGPQFTSKPNFGLFLDSSPDRWGRVLMLRKEALRAKREGVAPRKLQEIDFLLGVYDETRMGALRFKLCEDGPFQNDETALAAPPWIRLRDLEDASRQMENKGTTREQEKWLSLLLAPGSSLGGARPKASITSPTGELWLAKFPSKHDSYDVSAWEYAVMRMAKDAGLNTPETQFHRFSKHGGTFLAKRFDRTPEGKRIHFSSAMTQLGKSDGDDSTSYLELAEFIIGHSATPHKDLHELWKRIVFSIAISNTDDHLRNHGFLLTDFGWVLSPVYDINPNPSGQGLSLNITEQDNALEFDLALNVASFFQLGSKEANTYLSHIRSVTKDWRHYAERCGISKGEMDMMASAFHSS